MGSAWKSALPRVRFISVSPSVSNRFLIRSRVCSSVSSANFLTPLSGSGPMPAAPTMVAARAVAYWRSPPTPLDVSP